jgi:hypothetical protein
MIDGLRFLAAYASPSLNTNRPSASVLLISTVFPEYKVWISSGRVASGPTAFSAKHNKQCNGRVLLKYRKERHEEFLQSLAASNRENSALPFSSHSTLKCSEHCCTSCHVTLHTRHPRLVFDAEPTSVVHNSLAHPYQALLICAQKMEEI